MARYRKPGVVESVIAQGAGSSESGHRFYGSCVVRPSLAIPGPLGFWFGPVVVPAAISASESSARGVLRSPSKNSLTLTQPSVDPAGYQADAEKLKRVFPSAELDHLKRVVEELNSDIALFKLDSRLRLAHFLAQCRAEAGARLQGMVENLNYSPAGLKSTFSYYRLNPGEADKDGYTKDIKTGAITAKANQQEIANKAYASRNGNGDKNSGDGWRYRGRGFIQVTGRGNYKSLNDAYKKSYKDTADFISKPELLEDFPHNLRSAVCFWLENGLPNLADAGSAGAHVDAITAKVNRYTKSKKERQEYFTSIYNALA